MYIQIKDINVYYETYGSGIPIIMIHGWGMDHRIMKGCMETILKKKKGYKRIYFDLPGMGKSTENGSIKNSDDVLRIIIAFIDYIIPGQQFLLAGESYGGYLSRGLLQKRHSEIIGLLLICPLIYPGKRKGNVPSLSVIEKDQAFLNKLTKDELDSFTYMNVVLTKKNWKKYKKDIHNAILSQNKKFLENILDSAFTIDINKEKIFYDRPALILTGRQDTEVGFKDQASLFIDFTRATVAVLDKAGHNLQIEQDILFKALVSEWLDRVNLFKR